MIGNNRRRGLLWIKLFAFVHVHINAIGFEQVELGVLVRNVGTGRIVDSYIAIKNRVAVDLGRGC